MLKGSFLPYALRTVGRVAEHLLQQARETLETVQIDQVPRARRSPLGPREPFGERIGTEPVGMEDVEQAHVSHPLGPDQLFTAGVHAWEEQCLVSERQHLAERDVPAHGENAVRLAQERVGVWTV